MTKRFISLLLMLTLLFSTTMPSFGIALGQTPATDKDIQNSLNALTNAVNNLNNVFSDNQAKGVIDVFVDFANNLRTAGTYVAAINSGVTFLKLLGVIKDGNTAMLSSIMEQMTVMGEQIADMDRKLDRLTEDMAKVQASVEFNARIEKAMLFENNWKDFEYRYMEKGLDDLIIQYNSFMLKGIQSWCQNEGKARLVNGMDNTCLVLAYDNTENGYKLIYSKDNGRPESAGEDSRILVLDSDILPQQLSWNVNTYRESIKAEIVKNMKDKIASDGFSAFDAENFPAFETGKGLTDELLGELAEDAVDLLTYRVTAAQMNMDSLFSLQVVQQFSNYCTHLVSDNDGIDAIAKAMFLTHAFEYQIADDYKDLFDRMAVKTGVYGSFVLNVLGMSDYVNDADKASTLASYCSTLITVDETKREGLTGRDNFCYLTSKNLCFGTASFTDSGEIKSKHRGMVNSYESCKIGDTVTDIRYGQSGKAFTADKLIGDTDTLLLQYYMNNNGITADFDFYNEKLGQNAAKDYGSTVISIVGSQSLPLNDNNLLKVTNAVGSYFSGKTSVRLSSLPSDASSEYIASRRMMNGSLMDTKSGSVSVNKALSALAIYGESHWYWETDEAAFLGGPSDNASMTSSCTKEKTDVEFPSTEIYTFRYTQKVSYNCLINEAIPELLSPTTGSTVLSSYAKLCKEIRDSIKIESEKNGTSDIPGKNTSSDSPTAPDDVSSPYSDIQSDTVAFGSEKATSDTAHSSEEAASDTANSSEEAASDTANSSEEAAADTKNPSEKAGADDTMHSFENALLWIIVGAVAVAIAKVIAVVLMKNSKNKRV